MTKDMIWTNIRLGLVALGVGLLVKYFPHLFTQETATEIVAPIVGGLVALASIIWANVVGSRAVKVPEKVARRPDIETISPVTGKVEPPDIYR